MDDSNDTLGYFVPNPPEPKGRISVVNFVVGALTLLAGIAGVALMCAFLVQAGRPVNIEFLILTVLLAAPGTLAMYMGIVMVGRRKSMHK